MFVSTCWTTHAIWLYISEYLSELIRFLAVHYGKTANCKKSSLMLEISIGFYTHIYEDKALWRCGRIQKVKVTVFILVLPTRFPVWNLSLFKLFLHVLGPGERHASGVQVSRCIWIMHHQNLLDNTPQVPSAGLHSQGQVSPGCTRGAGSSQPQQASHLPEDQETPFLPEAHGHRASLYREVTKLLRGRPSDRQHGNAGSPVQQNSPAAQQLWPDVLRSGI